MTVVMAATTTSQGRLLRRISIANRPRPFRVVVLGQVGVGKSALTVRFLTRRFIGDYDPNLEKVYTCTRCVDGDTVVFEVLDTAQPRDGQGVEESIRWADAYILLYSVADRCSLNECLRLKFLINAYGKRSRKFSTASPEGALSSNPVALVGNQNDRSLDRMVPLQEGVACAAQLGCVAFYEISVRECCDSVHTIFEDLYMCHKRPKKFRAIYPRTSVTEYKFPGSGPSRKNSPSNPANSQHPQMVIHPQMVEKLQSGVMGFRHCASAPNFLTVTTGVSCAGSTAATSLTSSSSTASMCVSPQCISSSYYYCSSSSSSSSASSSPDRELELNQYIINRRTSTVSSNGGVSEGEDGLGTLEEKVWESLGLSKRRTRRNGRATLMSSSSMTSLTGKADAEAAAAAEIASNRRRDALQSIS